MRLLLFIIILVFTSSFSAIQNTPAEDLWHKLNHVYDSLKPELSEEDQAYFNMLLDSINIREGKYSSMFEKNYDYLVLEKSISKIDSSTNDYIAYYRNEYDYAIRNEEGEITTNEYGGFNKNYAKYYEQEYSIKHIKERYHKFKPLQKCYYNKTLIVYTGCVRQSDEKQRATKLKTKQLKNQYQIMILVKSIDGERDEFNISFQTPAKNISFKNEFFYSPVWDF